MSSKDIREIESIGRRIPKVRQPLFRADICTDHFQNLLMFGQCWKHEADGSMKKLFAKKR